MTLAAITAKNRAAKILLDADKPLTYYTILSKWGVRTIPSKREIQQVLAKYSIFVKIGVETSEGHGGTNKRITYSHIDHTMLSEWLEIESAE